MEDVVLNLSKSNASSWSHQPLYRENLKIDHYIDPTKHLAG